MILSDAAVVILRPDSTDTDWHDPYSEASDVLAARLGGYVVRANVDPETILADYRNQPHEHDHGHEFVRDLIDGSLVCVTHATVALAGEERCSDRTCARCSECGRPVWVDPAQGSPFMPVWRTSPDTVCPSGVGHLPEPGDCCPNFKSELAPDGTTVVEDHAIDCPATSGEMGL